MTIRYLTYDDIDKSEWDACIQSADNSLLYAQSCYLDAMAKHWDALIMDDYKAVMPLTWNKKYGIYYLYQPSFTACLGVFGTDITSELLTEFLNHIPKKFRYWDFYLNQGNYFQLTKYPLYQRINYVLSLKESYENIYRGYRENIKRNLKKSIQLKIQIKKGFDVEAVINTAQQQQNGRTKPGKAEYNRFKQLYQLLLSRGQAITYGVFTATNELMASCVFFLDDQRAYYILVGNHPNGKAIGASPALVDAFIKDHAGQNLILDFEGSDIQSLAFFYSSFGATEEKYAGIKVNRLPKLARYFKK